MSLWGQGGDWRPARSATSAKSSERRFRIPRGTPDEVWITSHCETHGFTDAKFLRAAENGQTVFRGDCGCEILHGDFLLETQVGHLVKLKVKPAKPDAT